jgi:hypothetical protein
MHLRKQSLVFALIGAFLLATGSVVGAQNVLVNPGFESGLTGWTAFGNAYPEATNAPQFVPRSGNGLVSMFGNFWGSFNVTGIFQEFPTTPGQVWEMSSSARHWSGDPMVGIGAPDNNWVVQKIAWFDGGGNEIGGVESTLLNGTFTTDVWHDATAISGAAPAGTVKLQALILYLQPLWDGGAAHVDDVSLVNVSPVKTESATWGKVKALYR